MKNNLISVDLNTFEVSYCVFFVPVLPEMPLPSPLPQTLSNKSLLFHPRVAEEAHILLSLRDEALVPQLVQSLAQTSSDHMLVAPSL